MNTIIKRIVGLTLVGALLLSTPMVEEFTGNSGISMTASAASTVSTYDDEDLARLESAHGKFIAKYGKSAYLYRVSTDKVMKAYVKEVQHALNFLASYYKINDDTVEDSYYGSDCKKLVKAIQGKLHCERDGYCGNATYSAMVSQLRDILNSQNANESQTSGTDYVANAKDIFVHQSPQHCTASAASMLLRNYARISGASDWTSINERTFRTGQASPYDTWNYGLLTDITMNRPGKSYDGLKIKQYALKGTASEKKEKIKKVLESTNPEGVVLYGTKGGCHAVYMSYDMKILDPWYDDGGKYRDLSQSANSCSDSFSDITYYWVILH